MKLISVLVTALIKREYEFEVNEGCIIIKYPELIIKNSNDQEHLIRDLFVHIQLYENAVYTIRGRRTTFTENEAYFNYTHSHLSASTINASRGDYNNFCLGDSYLINYFKQSNWQESDGDLFFYTLDNYLRWESLEGGPYIKMGVVKTAKSGNSSIIYDPPLEFPCNSDFIPFHIENDTVIIDRDWMIGQFTPEYYKVGDRYYKYAEGGTGDDYPLVDQDLEALRIERRGNSVKFKGDWVPCNILRTQERVLTERENITLVVHPKQIDNYATTISREIKKWLWKITYIDSKVQDEDSTKSLEPDDIFVF